MQHGHDVIHSVSRFVAGDSVHVQSIAELVQKHEGQLQGRVDDSMMSSLGQHLASNSDLELLDTGQCQITNSGATDLATSGLDSNASLKYIRLARNKIELPGTVSILKALSSAQSSVRALDMEKNRIFHGVQPNYVEFARLREHLYNCCHLRFISFCDTGMCDGVVANILDSLTYHGCIGWMDLSHGDIGDQTVHALVEMKKVNTSLIVVGFEYCKINDECVHLMLQSPDIMDMDGVHVYSNPCSMDKLQPPIFNCRRRYSTSTILNFISE